MSDSVTGPLVEAELTDARRFCGYPAYGAGTSGFQSWRFFTSYGTLEYRLANLSAAELAVVRNYLSQLNALEAALLGAGNNLDTDKAAVWQRNRSEVDDRDALFASWRVRLCGFLGVPPGPALQTTFAIRM
jgi:hypothetical protein